MAMEKEKENSRLSFPAVPAAINPQVWQEVLGPGLNLGLQLSLPLVLGVGFGGVADRRLNTAPLFVILGMVFGLISVSYNLRKFLKETDVRSKDG